MRLRRAVPGARSLPPPVEVPAAGLEALAGWIGERRRIVAITGAGISAEAGIPAYRDHEGNWQHAAPVQYREFVGSTAVRKRYWARSLAGWQRFAEVDPGSTHQALAALQRHGHVHAVVTQNVDRLHQRAGSKGVIDLHGRLDRVRCLDCGRLGRREALQGRLLALNPDWVVSGAPLAPDGDAQVEGVDFSAFRVPSCEVCGGMLKPDVVFYGEGVPRPRAEAAMTATKAADGVLVAGSSLMVWSAFRLVHAAAEQGIPVIAVNRGRTRGDALLAFKFDGDSGPALAAAAARLGTDGPPAGV